MKKKKGFTLIELLAVIVILAIISLIAVPIITNLINDMRKKTAGISAKNYIGAVEKKVLTSGLLEEQTYNDGEYLHDEISVDVEGTKPTAGMYQLSKGKVVNATFCVNGFVVTYQEDRTIVGEQCEAEDTKYSSILSVSKNSLFLTYPDTETVQILENTSNGEVTCETSNSGVATCEISDNNLIIRAGETEGYATLTLTAKGNSRYKDANASIVVSTQKGLLSVNANNYTGVYDGNAHGISVISANTMIMYGTEEGTYNLDDSPTYTDVGTYTVYYQVTRAGYNTITGSKTVTITKAPGEIELASLSGSVVYQDETEVNVTGTGELSVSVTDSSVVSAEIVNGKLVITGLNVGSTTVIVTSAEASNYMEVSETYSINVTKANNVLVLSSNVGSVTYPDNISFEVTQNPSGGALSCASSNTNAATCDVSGNTVTVTAGTEAVNAVTITVTSAATSNYNAGQAAYVVTSENGLMSVTASGYSGTYDGNAHGISVESSGATIKYGEISGTYDLDASPTYTNVGTYTVYYQVTKAGYQTVTGSKTVTITKANGSVTAPTAKNLTYNGNAQELINAGSSTTGTIQYKLDSGEYSENIPAATLDGTYTVYYRVIGDGNHDDVAENSISVTISKATLSYTTAGYSGVYDGNAHGITVESSGATIKYGTSNGTYNLDENPTYTDVGTYTVYYQITKAGYNTVTGSKTVTITKANNILRLSSNTGTVTYPNNISFDVTQNPSGGELSCASSNTNAATCEVNGNIVTVIAGTEAVNAVTITVTSAATNNYNAGQAAYVVTSENGLMSVTASGYDKPYDGSAHGISVESSGATIKYGEVSGTYNLDASPTYTDVGTYTVYYEVTKAGYQTVTGNRTVNITKTTGSVTAPTAKSLTYNGSAQELINAGSSTTGTIQYKLGTGEYSGNIPSATSDGTYTVYYRVIGDNNHNDVSENSISVTINKATLTYTADGYSGVYDGNAHGISVESSGATIKYGTSSGTYNLDASPTYTNAGTYTVYYQITRTGYNTVTGNKTVTITKANGSVTSPTAKSLTYNGNAQELINAGSSTTGTIQYKLGTGEYSGNIPTATSIGTYTVYYRVIGDNNHEDVAENSISVTISKANNTLTLSANSGTVTYPGHTTFTVTTNTSGGTLSCTSSNTNAATCEVSGNTITVTAGTTAASNVTITVTSAATNSYKSASAAYVVTSENGILSVTANGYSGPYDGNPHGISVESSGATIKYGTTSGTYNLNASPTYTAVGTYTVYYQVTKAGYQTVTGYRTVELLPSYDTGDQVIVSGYHWRVIGKDGNNLILLMEYSDAATLAHATYNHCTNDKDTSTDCGVSGGGYYQYSWDKSLIRAYLNGDFYNSLDSVTKNNLVATRICADPSMQQSSAANYSYGGYTEAEIAAAGKSCSSYVSDKVRLITMAEYHNLTEYSSYKSASYPASVGSLIIPNLSYITRVSDNTSSTWLYSSTAGNWWTMNAFSGTTATYVTRAYAITSNGGLTSTTAITTTYKVRPVIVIKNSSSVSGVPKYTVTFETNGGSAVASQTVYEGEKATNKSTSKSGYTFNGWYSNSGLTTAYNFNTPVTSDLILYAKFTRNTPTPTQSISDACRSCASNVRSRCYSQCNSGCADCDCNVYCQGEADRIYNNCISNPSAYASC